jgi:tetratricopeptide (TPR) repeat protein
MNDFMQQPGQAPQPFAMDQLRQDLPHAHSLTRRTPSPGWSAEFDPGQQARMEAAFANSQMGQQRPNNFSASEFARFQHSGSSSAQQSSTPVQQAPQFAPSYQSPMNMGYMGGGMGMGMGMGYNSMPMHQQPDMTTGKGKEKLVELDDKNWEEQFAQLDQDSLSEQANQAMERELEEVDRLVQSPPDHYSGDFERVWRDIQTEYASRQMTEDVDYDTTFSKEDLAAWENFDSSLGMGNNNPWAREPMLGEYMFEANNPFLEQSNASRSAFDQGVEILQSHGNLSLAALAFEAAVQQNPNHVEAWTYLGSAQAQNEKESPAIRALEKAIQLDPNNLDALMGLAVSYTNEGYETTAYRTLERWLSVKYPQIHPPDQVSEASDVGFTEQAILHDKVTNLFIKAAQLSPSGAQMDPDVQVGLGVLFYGDDDFDKAVDCFNAALASHETGISNQESQVHLLWNRLGATLANSGKSEDAIAAYCKALEHNPNFVRARYNLGVSCINIGCYPEAAGHLLGALNLHRVVTDEGLDKAREILRDGNGNDVPDAELARMIQQNESTNLYDTLRRALSGMGRRDLMERVGNGMNLDQFRGEFDF